MTRFELLLRKMSVGPYSAGTLFSDFFSQTSFLRLLFSDLKSSIIRSGQCPAGSWETELLSTDQGSASRRPYRSHCAPANRTATPLQSGPRGTLPCTRGPCCRCFRDNGRALSSCSQCRPDESLR